MCVLCCVFCDADTEMVIRVGYVERSPDGRLYAQDIFLPKTNLSLIREVCSRHHVTLSENTMTFIVSAEGTSESTVRRTIVDFESDLVNTIRTATLRATTAPAPARPLAPAPARAPSPPMAIVVPQPPHYVVFDGLESRSAWYRAHPPTTPVPEGYVSLDVVVDASGCTTYAVPPGAFTPVSFVTEVLKITPTPWYAAVGWLGDVDVSGPAGLDLVTKARTTRSKVCVDHHQYDRAEWSFVDGRAEWLHMPMRRNLDNVHGMPCLFVSTVPGVPGAPESSAPASALVSAPAPAPVCAPAGKCIVCIPVPRPPKGTFRESRGAAGVGTWYAEHLPPPLTKVMPYMRWLEVFINGDSYTYAVRPKMHTVGDVVTDVLRGLYADAVPETWDAAVGLVYSVDALDRDLGDEFLEAVQRAAKGHVQQKISLRCHGVEEDVEVDGTVAVRDSILTHDDRCGLGSMPTMPCLFVFF